LTKFAKVPTDQSNILHPKMSQIARNFSTTFPNFLLNFCHKFRATFGFFGAQLSGGLGLPIVRERQQMFHFELPSEQLEKKEKRVYRCYDKFLANCSSMILIGVL